MLENYDASPYGQNNENLHTVTVVDFSRRSGRHAEGRPEGLQGTIKTIKDGTVLIEEQMLELKRLSEELADHMRQL